MHFEEGLVKEEELLWNQIDKNIPVIFWGCGGNAHFVKDYLGKKGISPTVYCDNNEKNWGKKIDGKEIISYEQVKERYENYSIVLTVAIHNALEIIRQLKLEGEKHSIYHMEKAFKVEESILEYEEIHWNKQKLEEIYKILADDTSRKIFTDNINFRVSGDKTKLVKYADGDSFFDEKLIPKSDNYSYVDVGAYTGDTLLRFYAFCGGKYRKIYALEPDWGNYKALCDMIKYGRLENVETFQVGGWDKRDTLTLYTVKEGNQRNFDSPNFFEEISKDVPHRWQLDNDGFAKEQIEVDTVDHLLQGSECNLIKINALAADYQSLKGCKHTIEQYKPILVGEFGTRKENLFEMLGYINRINPSYDIFLREKRIFSDYKTVYFAIDKEERKSYE